MMMSAGIAGALAMSTQACCNNLEMSVMSKFAKPFYGKSELSLIGVFDKSL